MENASNEFLDEIILSQADHRRQKVAMLHILVWKKCKAEGRFVSDERFNDRLRYLVDLGALEAFGDISSWRYSEVLRAPDATNRNLSE